VVDALGPHEIATMSNAELHPLKKVLSERADCGALDGYGYYLYVYHMSSL